MCVCPGHTSLSFYGNSYIKYHLIDSWKSGDVKLQLRIRTLQRSGVILHTHPAPCAMLKVPCAHTHISTHKHLVNCLV